MKRLLNWLDNSKIIPKYSEKVAWKRVVPFLLLHLGCFAAFYTGVSATALIVAISLFWLRIFIIGAFYHRYFSHKTYKTNRFWQFIFALLGGITAQRGPIWWAAHHRNHHQASDTINDPHSPIAHSFWRSHVSWFMTHKHFNTDHSRVKDWLRFPELVWLDRFDKLIPLAVLFLLFGIGQLLAASAPQLNTNGLQLVVWGFCISTVASLHLTLSINSLCHLYGRRRYETTDQSRNNWLLAILTLGEGWHNNHHHYPATARQGFFWWEIDVTYYILCVMQKLHIISDLKKVPARVLKP